MHSLLWGFKLLQERCMKAALLRCKLLEHGVLACSRQPSSSSSTRSKSTGFQGHPEEGREAQEHPEKSQISQIFRTT